MSETQAREEFLELGHLPEKHYPSGRVECKCGAYYGPSWQVLGEWVVWPEEGKCNELSHDEHDALDELATIGEETESPV